MDTTINNEGTRIMNEHGIYPLADSPANNALLPIVCRNDRRAEQVDLYVDAKGLHLVWRTAKRDKNGDAILKGRSMLMETKSVDVTAEFAAKLDYDGAAPDFNNTVKADNDEPWFITSPELGDGYMFTIVGVKDNKGTHLSHVFATDGEHSRLLLAADSTAEMSSLEHTGTGLAISRLTRDEITTIDTDADIISKAEELLK